MSYLIDSSNQEKRILRDIFEYRFPKSTNEKETLQDLYNIIQQKGLSHKDLDIFIRKLSNDNLIKIRVYLKEFLNYLEKKRILKSKVEGKNKYFSLNLENIKTKSYLLQSEIHQTDLFMEKYSQFKTFLKSFDTTVPIIVFGSFARFTADKNSDLDLLVISKKEINLPFHLLPFKPHRINMSEKIFLKALEEQADLIKEIEENHIILNNHSFYINMMWGQYGK